MKTHEFEKSKIVGDLGEQLILSTYSKDLEFAGGVINDFLIRDGRYMELKTDTYDMNTTPNFFMERYSDDRKFKAGGPWQALEKESHVYLYFFAKNRKLFWFDNVTDLVYRLESFQNMMTLCPIYNTARYGKGYNTLGYKVRRSLLRDLYIEINLGDDLPI